MNGVAGDPACFSLDLGVLPMCNRWFHAGRWLLVVVCVGLLSATASAQSPVGKFGKDDTGILQWVVAMGILLLLAAVGMMNPKRTHQD